jgi:hypothetical protein
MATTSPPLANSATNRIDRLSDQVQRLRTRASSGNLDHYLLMAGALLMPLGVLFIILGWVGASRTPLPFEQNDYLISGGILGLALVIAGGFVYFAYWQTVGIRESRDQSAELSQAIRRLEMLLAGGTTTPSGITIAAETFVATTGGSIFHRQDCAAVAGRTDLSPVDPAATDLRPCRICTPLDPRS